MISRGIARPTPLLFSPDGKLLASVGRWSSPSRSSTATILWNAQTGMMLHHHDKGQRRRRRCCIFAEQQAGGGRLAKRLTEL